MAILAMVDEEVTIPSLTQIKLRRGKIFLNNEVLSPSDPLDFSLERMYVVNSIKY